MTDQESFAGRLLPIIGRPAATLFVEEGTDRHFLIEAAAIAVATYLGGKFLDGFVDGLGITDLGKTVGIQVKNALAGAAEFLIAPPVEPAQETAMAAQGAALQDATSKLLPYAGNAAARAAAEEAVSAALQEKGIPAGEARRIAASVGQQLLPVGHG